jgi:Domain of unknown function (DUF4262)
MCWRCENPEATYRDYLDQLQGIIDVEGWALQCVERDRRYPSWAYTVGLSAQDEPELVVIGLPDIQAHQLLNGFARGVLEEGAAPVPGERITMPGGRLLEVVEVAEPTAHLHTAVSLYGPYASAVQLVYADDRGHWPWDAGYRGGKGGQPVLGQRTLPGTS